MTARPRSRVGWNAGVGAATQLLILALSFVTTPVLLHALGAELFGSYAVIGSLTTYVGVLDLGIGASLIRYMSFHEERGESDRVAQIATFGLVFYTTLAVLLLPLLLLAAPWIARTLSFSAPVSDQISVLLTIVLGIYIGSSMVGVLSSRLASIHKLDMASASNLAGVVVYSALVIMLRPATIQQVFACLACQLVTSAALMYAAVRLRTGSLFISPFSLRWHGVKELFSFGIWTQLSSVTAVVNLEADKAIISSNIGAAKVTPYQVANRLAMVSRLLPLQLIGSLLPHVTAQVSRGLTADQVADLYGRGTRSLMLVTLVIGGFVAGAADALLQLWLGTRIPGAASLCVALIISYAMNNATGVGTTIIKAQGQPRWETYYGIISAAINVAVTVLLIDRMGLMGVVIGTIVGNVAGSVFFIAVFHRQNSLGWWRTIGRWLWKLIVMTVAAASVANAILTHAFQPAAVGFATLPALFIAGLSYVAVVLMTGWITSFWRPEDYDLVRLVLTRARLKRSAA